MDPFEFFREHWNTFKKFRWTFLSLALIVASIAYNAAAWRYQGIIESVHERLALKDEQLQSYKNRLDLTPTYNSASSRLSNTDLKNRSIKLVKTLRDALEDFWEEQSRSMRDYSARSYEAATEGEKNLLFREETNVLIRLNARLNAQYNREFKADAVLLRDEMLSRLSGQKTSINASTYEYPVNPIGMEEVATDLEKLARNLPLQP